MTETSSTRAPVALVTGGRRGIGRAIGLALAAKGFDIIVNDVEQDDAARETLAGIAAAGRRAAFERHDVSDMAAHAAFVARCWSRFGSIDCLVNNAGVMVAKRGDMMGDEPEDFARVMNINLNGPYFLTLEVAKRMLAEAAPAGVHRSIVNLASVNSVMASTTRASYCISKAGVTMMTSLFAMRLAPHGIAVNEVRPGVTRTDINAGVRADYDKKIAEGLHPMRRWGEPQDIAATVAALASGALPFVTGESIHVDGGMHVREF